MIRFIMALYIIAENGLAIPETVWTISWVMLGITCIVLAAKAFAELVK